jgi:protein-S-isoprenylcysteine O-methyltransferase Ste14
MMRSLEHRIPPPVLMVFIGGAMGASLLGAGPALPPTLRWVLATVFLLAAAAFGMPAFRAFARARTTINPVAIDQATTLVTSGIYRLTRNPMYVSLACLLCAWAFWLARPLAALGPLVFVLLIDRLQIAPEERVLTARFGAAYLEYQRSVRRWL